MVGRSGRGGRGAALARTGGRCGAERAGELQLWCATSVVLRRFQQRREALGWGVPVQRLAWPAIEFLSDVFKVVRAVELRSVPFGKYCGSSQFVGTLVPGQRPPQMRGQGPVRVHEHVVDAKDSTSRPSACRSPRGSSTPPLQMGSCLRCGSWIRST